MNSYNFIVTKLKMFKIFKRIRNIFFNLPSIFWHIQQFTQILGIKVQLLGDGKIICLTQLRKERREKVKVNSPGSEFLCQGLDFSIGYISLPALNPNFASVSQWLLEKLAGKILEAGTNPFSSWFPPQPFIAPLHSPGSVICVVLDWIVESIASLPGPALVASADSLEINCLMNKVAEPGPAVPFRVCLGLLCQVQIIAPVTCFARTQTTKLRWAGPPDWSYSCRGSQWDPASVHLPLSGMKHNAGLQSCQMQGSRGLKQGCHHSPGRLQMASPIHPHSHHLCLANVGGISLRCAQRQYVVFFFLHWIQIIHCFSNMRWSISMNPQTLTPSPQHRGHRCLVKDILKIQPIISLREEPQGWSHGSFSMGLPSLNGTSMREKYKW